MEVRSGPEVVVSIDVALGFRKLAAARREGFTRAQVRDLRKLAKAAPRPKVRLAASVVLEFATGASYDACARETPYGPGWVRALVGAFHDGGVDALRDRPYRRPRRKR